MKKIFIIIAILLFPFNVLAYSNQIIPGGETLGIQIDNDGVLVVGFYKVNDEYINQNLKIGDRIISINGNKVSDVNSLVDLIEKNIKDNKVSIVYKRNEKEYKTNLQLDNFNGTYRTGLYVKGSIVGIGTLTYIDPQTNIYGALGHVINESRTNSKVEIKQGYTFNSKVTSFTRSIDGQPGSKNAEINYNSLFGTINKNTNYGIFGSLKTKSYNNNLMDVGNINEVKLGEAFIYTTDESNKTNKYKINIIQIDQKSKDKNYYFEITDKDLLKMSGGIVQGMSGSPIIQNNKIIGAVTRVVVDDVSKGYGINIVTMLEEGER